MATLPMRSAARIARENRWLDWFLVALSVWFFISPWVISFGGGAVPHNTMVPPHEEAAILAMTSRAAWNAWVCGAILFFVMLSAVGRLEASQEWIALILGAWIFAAPWALGFTPLGGASGDHWAVGIIVFLVAVWNLWRMRNVPHPADADTVAPPRSRPPRQPLV